MKLIRYIPILYREHLKRHKFDNQIYLYSESINKWGHDSLFDYTDCEN